MTVRSLSTRESLIELTRNTFKLDPTDVARAAAFLTATALIAQRVPAYELRYPRDLSALPGIARRLIAMAADLAATSVESDRADDAPGRSCQSIEVFGRAE
jgi:hypothetical protein